MKNTNLKSLRNQIDALNDELLLCLEKRFQVLDEIKNLKQNEQLKIYDPEREQEILQYIESRTSHLKIKDYVTKIFAQILFYSRSYMEQKK